MKSNSMLALRALVKRHISIFLKDRTYVFFSFLAPLIVFLLYVLFLSDFQVELILPQIEEAAKNLGVAVDTETMKKFAGAFINNWMISGVMAVSCISVAFNANAIMIRDKEHGAINDVLSSPVKRWVVFTSYIISCFIITFVICGVVLAISLIYLACTGGFMMSFGDLLAVLGITMLSIISASVLAVLFASFLKTQSALTSFTSVMSAGIGFLIGAYLPVSQMPGVRYLTCFIPGSYSVGLYRQYLLKGPMRKLAEVINDPNLANNLMNQYSVKMEFFGMEISWGWMVLALGLSILLFGGLLMLYYYRKKGNIYHQRKKRKK